MPVDLTFILERRLAVGGGIWTSEAMAGLAAQGFTHVINAQSEFDESELAAGAGLAALWNPTDDDLEPKPPEYFERAVEFARTALADPAAQLYVHCTAGIHRGPMIAAAILCSLGHSPASAMSLIARRRIGANFPEPYSASLYEWAHGAEAAGTVLRWRP